MKIALVQMEVIPGDLESNFQKIESSYKILSQNYDVVAFPEMALPGYFIGDMWEQNSFVEECQSFNEKLANLSRDSFLIFGSLGIDRKLKNEDGRIRKYNAAFCAHKGKFLTHPELHYPFWIKTLSPNYKVFDESRHFYDLRKLSWEQGKSVATLLKPLVLKKHKKSLRIALNICEDAWDENYFLSPIRELCRQGVDCILNLSTSPFTLNKNAKRDRILQDVVEDCRVPIFYVNCVGSQNIAKSVFVFDGASTVYTEEKKKHQVPFFKEEVLGFDLKTREAFLSKSEAGDELYTALFEGLKYTLKTWKIKKVVIGVSGGIDSALSAALYTKVLGKENVSLVNMPSRFNSSLTKNAARKLADHLGTAYVEVPIQKSFDSTLKQLSDLKDLSLDLNPFVLENIQARDRSSRILAAIAAAQGGVFTCNGNKTEMSVGYCTLYGDAGGFLAVLGDLWKGQIYELAHFINKHREVIPKESLEFVPSAELSSKQDVNKGEGDPFFYPYHDALFKSWIEDWNRKRPEDLLEAILEDRVEEILGMSREEVLKVFKGSKKAFVEDLERWWKAYTEMGVVKRVQSPPILMLSRRSYGNDQREFLGSMPLTRKYRDLKDKLLSKEHKYV